MGSLKWEKSMSWLKRIGFAGFIFFLIKGFIWIAVFFGLTEFFYN
jgi:hypothetical protein